MVQLVNNMHLKVALVLMLFCALHEAYRSPGRIRTKCCTHVSRQKIPFQITHYKFQPALGPCVQAVIFYTVEKGPICSDPAARWVSVKISEANSKAGI
ncbi:eotaxin-like precursor [Callorhinchus milii]|uniref:CC chemokine n=1 Tax=Callorhinchus milii TaxID=7868 RepID=K4FU67_CALMI|nr:eotaxin-like precursor [Callorhinchus milii]AFK11410.1 CC chemokine [Callorhinchus milii]|eukprot:gi/632934560/ref/XP_007885503.1/ PREDICTED: eotaxin-like [Callorhinchus milii]